MPPTQVRSATACASSSRSSTPWASPYHEIEDRGRRRRRSRRRSSGAYAQIAARGAADRTEARHDEARRRASRALARHVTDADIVLAGLFDRLRLDRHPAAPAQLSVAIGAMGLASSHALGLALGRPGQARDRARRRRQPADESRHAWSPSPTPRRRTSIHFVCENGTYEANGGHPIPGRDRRRLSRASRARPATPRRTTFPT